MGGVVAQEVDCFADFGERVATGFAGLACGERQQLGEMVLIKIRSPLEERRALRNRPRAPARKCRTGKA